MTGRSPELQSLIDLTEAAVIAQSKSLPSVMPLAEKIFASLRRREPEAGGGQPHRLPVCDEFATAVSIARHGPSPIPELANAFAAIEPQLGWHPRAGADKVAGNFSERHANAEIISANGLEYSDEVRIGTSLVAPNTDYPRHQHPPEEFYVVLSPGEWMQDDQPLQARRSGDLVHNVPNIWHAMRSDETPLLAIWCLWIADA